MIQRTFPSLGYKVLPESQLSPVNPLSHVQEYDPFVFEHVPFPHGLEEHSFTSIKINIAKFSVFLLSFDNNSVCKTNPFFFKSTHFVYRDMIKDRKYLALPYLKIRAKWGKCV